MPTIPLWLRYIIGGVIVIAAIAIISEYFAVANGLEQLLPGVGLNSESQR